MTSSSSTSGPALEPDALDDVDETTDTSPSWGAASLVKYWKWLLGALLVVVIVGIIVVLLWHSWANDEDDPKFDTFSATLAPYKGPATPDGLELGNGSALGCKPELTTVRFGSKASELPTSVSFTNGDSASAEWTTSTVILTIVNPDGLQGKYPAGFFNGVGASQGYATPLAPEGAKKIILTGHFDKDGAFAGVAPARGVVLCTDSVPK